MIAKRHSIQHPFENVRHGDERMANGLYLIILRIF